MSLTRTEAYADLLEVAGPGMGKVGLSIVPDQDGFIASLNSALRAGFAAIGVRPAARVVVDADFLRVPEADEDKLVAVAKLSIVNLVLLRWMKPNERENTTSQEWGNLHRQLMEARTALKTEVDLLGVDVPTLGVGLIGLGILEPGCEGPEF